MENKNLIALIFVFVFGFVSTVSAQERMIPIRRAVATTTDVAAPKVRPAMRVATSTRPINRATTTREVRKDERREEVQNKIEERRVEVQAKKAEMQEKRSDFKQDIAKRKVENATRVILATIERIEKIAERVTSRIEKVRANGGNTTESEGFVASARARLDEARVDIEAFAAFDLTSDKAQENFEVIRSAVSDTKEIIRMAHEDLMKAVRALGQVQSSVRATTTTNVR